MLPFGLTEEVLTAAAAETEVDSLAALGRLRAVFGAELATAAVTQTVLRRSATRKFGPAADGMFFTRDGLEQATRPEVARHHARRLVAAGARRVVDLGCGIGSDARAFADAGLEVVAVEIDPATAAVARANLWGRAEVLDGDAVRLVPELLDPGTAVFCDPARRSDGSRVWRVQDFEPGWDFVRSLLTGDRPAAVKLGPALPHALVPPGVEAEWVADRGDTVEVCLWAGFGCEPDTRAALVLPSAERVAVRGSPPALPVTHPRRFVHEPSGAVIRAGAVTLVGATLGATMLHPRTAYLTSDQSVASPLVTSFEVREVFAYKERLLRQWVRDRGIGTLEIKKRGIEMDPAALRRRLAPRGSGAATIIVTKVGDRVCVLVVERSAG